MHTILTRSARLLTFAGLLFVVGCGENSPPPASTEISTSAKQQVAEFIAFAKKNPKQAGTQCQMLLESTEAYVRDFGEGFQPLHDAVKELNDLYSQKADPKAIAEKLPALEDALSKLP